MGLRLRGLLALGATLVASVVGVAAADAATPRRASAFENSVGVNVHMSYFNTAYNKWELVRDKLLELGVHHVRDGACVGCREQRKRLLALGAAGIGVDYIMREPGSPDTVASLVDLLAGPMRSTVDSIEGPNEYDHSQDKQWASHLRSYQRQLYRLAKSTPSLAHVPVLAPTLVSWQDYFKLGNIARWADIGNIHPYAGGQVPTANLQSNRQSAHVDTPHRRIAVTEAGYHTALASKGGHPPVSEAAEAAYVPRLFLDFFRAGITRTYLYELVDERPDSSDAFQEKHFGLLRNDFGEKPAFRTLRALLQSVRPTTTKRFRLSPLSYRIAGSRSDVRQLLLQTGPRRYALAVWRDVTVWKTTTHRPMAVSAATVHLSLGGRSHVISTRDLRRSRARRARRSSRSVSLRLTGMPVIVSIAR
jgi:hypothetical protein